MPVPTTEATTPTTTEAADRLAAELRRARRETLKAPPRLTVDQWADAYRQLAREASSTGGRWKTSRVEVARGPMRAVTEPGVRIITVMTCTQLLKSSLLENVFGYFAHQDPAPMLLVQPKDAAAEAFSKERIAPMIAATPVLADLVGTRRVKTSDDTLTFKSFPGGFLALVSAGSPTNLAMRPIRVAMYDEIDKYEVTKEGDPVALGDERMATFPTSWLSIRACSPTDKGLSRIERSWLASDQRLPFLGCPHCGHRQHLDFFRHVRWERTAEGEHRPETAQVWCEACGSAWSEPERLAALRDIRWHQTRPFTCCGEVQEPLVRYRSATADGEVWRWDDEHIVGRAICRHCGADGVRNHHAGFQAGKLLSPWKPVSDVAAKWIAAKDHDDLRRSWFNTQLGLPYQADLKRDVKAHVLAARREQWPADRVPDAVVAITAGVDVQDNRLCVEVVGWGRDEESWSLAYEELLGDPSSPAVWGRLDEAYLRRRWVRVDGRPMAVEAAAVDTGGHHTQVAYRFCIDRAGRRVWPIKGASDRPGKNSPVWPRVEIKRQKQRSFRPHIIGVNAAKDQIRSRWLVDKPGPGYCHVPADREIAWFDHQLAEQVKVETIQGHRVRRWVQTPGRANEGLDCRVYAYAALVGLQQMHGLRLNRRAETIRADAPEPAPVETAIEDRVPVPADPPTAASGSLVNRMRQRRIGRSSFVGR